jgi:cytochrome P450
VGDNFDGLLQADSFFVDPYPAYSVLRLNAPVYWSEAWGGWVLTRYADVASVLRDAHHFSSAGRISYLLAQLDPGIRRQVEDLERHYRVGIAHVDPPDHTRLRALLTPFFTPRKLVRLQAVIERVVDTLLDRAAERVAAHGSRDAMLDIVEEIAYPLPAIIVLELIGAPAADRDHFRRWALAVNNLFAEGGRVTQASVMTAQSALAEMREYVLRLAAERSRAPRDDVISALVAEQRSGGRLNEAELVSTCVTLFVAGHETTTNLIGNSMIALLLQPEKMAQLRTQPELMRGAVEEFLRYDTPVQRGWRIAAQDVEIDGQPIRSGALVLPMLGAANRDPARFAEPDLLDFHRFSMQGARHEAEARHLGFGYGIHFCIGAPLARLEVPAALSGLLRRFPHMRLEPTTRLRWRRDIALRGVESLPVYVS